MKTSDNFRPALLFMWKMTRKCRLRKNETTIDVIDSNMDVFIEMFGKEAAEKAREAFIELEFEAHAS